MNDRIKELAEQAGLTTFGAMEIDKFIDLEFFAELIRADEREMCAKLIEHECHDDMTRAEEATAIRQRGEK